MGRRRLRKRKNDDDNDDNGFAAWGGYMAAKKCKLLEQYTEAVDSETNKLSDIFKGVSIFVNGYTSPSAEELKNLMSLHGGVYHHYHIPARTTHIVASNLPDTKIKQLGWNNKIVKPEWIVASIEANKLLNYSNYLLYTNQNRLQPKLNFEKTTENDSKRRDPLRGSRSPDIFDGESKLSEIYKDEVGEEISDSSKPVTSVTKRNPVNRTLNATDPRFLSEFYNNSRLHHISTLGATFKNRILMLREQHSFAFTKRGNLKQYAESLNVKRTDEEREFDATTPVIMHIDMDCFFVSVGLRNRPELMGQPVAVTHSRGGQEPSTRSGVDRQAEIDCYEQKMQDRMKNRVVPADGVPRLRTVGNQSMSEIASCSYEAREAGVKNGMFVGTALKLCPNLKTIPYDFDGYKRVASALYDTMAEYTLNIEAVSCDEMFVDVTDILKETGATVEQWATYIRDLIRNRTGCPCSAGFGSNRLQARMATKTAKPDGQHHLEADNVENYMSDFQVDDLPGVGYSTAVKLHAMGTRTCRDLQLIGLSKLQQEFGNKIGKTLYQHCRGIDERPLVYKHERKSVSSEVNYGIRFKDDTDADQFIKQLIEEVHTRLVQVRMRGKCITLKLMVRSKDAPVESSKFMGHGVCDCTTKSTTLSTATADLNVISREIFSMYRKLNFPSTELRGIGVHISKLEKSNKSSAKNVLTDFLKPIDAMKISENADAAAKSEERNDVFGPLEIAIPKIKLTCPEDDDDEENDPEIDFEDFGRYVSTGDTCSQDVKEKLKSIILSRHFQNKSKPIEKEKEAISFSDPSKTSRKQSAVRSGSSIDADDGKTRATSLPVCVVKPSSRSGKGRGRPKSGLGKQVKNSNMNMYSYLKPRNQSDATAVRHAKPSALPAEGIDLKFLAELPEDIRREVIREYNLQDVSNLQTNSSGEREERDRNVTADARADVNDHVKSACEKSSARTVDANGPQANVQAAPDAIGKHVESRFSSSDSLGIFMRLNYKQIKQLIHIWANTHERILDDDIGLLKSYFSLLAHQNKIEDLFMFFKFMYNQVLKAGNCNWHIGYVQIVDAVQDIVSEKYGGTLWVYKEFHCDKECEAKCQKL